MKNQNFCKRLSFAIAGLRVALREHSFRTQLVFGVLAGIALLLLRPALLWWALVGTMVALVLAAELFNTALEQICDHLHPQHHPTIKIVKDLAAGAVLILSLASLWVALLMLFSVLRPW